MKQSLPLQAFIDLAPFRALHVWVIGLGMALLMADGFDTQSIGLVAPVIAAEWHVSPSAFGLVFGAGLTGGLIGAPLFGCLADRIGRKPTITAMVVLFAVATLLTPLATSAAMLTALRFVTGLGLGGALPTIVTLVSEFTPTRMRTNVVAFVFAGFPLGSVIGSLISSQLIPMLGWRSVFFFGGGVPLLVLPLFLLRVPESPRFLATHGREGAAAAILVRLRGDALWNGVVEASEEARASVRALFSAGRRESTIRIWLTLFCSLMVTVFLVSWMPMLARQAGITLGGAILGVSVLNLGGVLGSVVVGRLADRFGLSKVVGLSYLAGACAITLLGLSGRSEALLLSMAFATGIMTVGAQMCAVAMASALYPTELRATGVGWAIGVGRIGSVLGPVIGGFLIAADMPQPLLFLIAGGVSLGAALASIGIKFGPRTTRRAETANFFRFVIGRTE
ncbi:MAG TPA: MFS transporter [Stellaceae bacterium]|nr:MFS transporter [Stellaceae bacterium]